MAVRPVRVHSRCFTGTFVTHSLTTRLPGRTTRYNIVRMAPRSTFSGDSTPQIRGRANVLELRARMRCEYAGATSHTRYPRSHEPWHDDRATRILGKPRRWRSAAT